MLYLIVNVWIKCFDGLIDERADKPQRAWYYNQHAKQFHTMQEGDAVRMQRSRSLQETNGGVTTKILDGWSCQVETNRNKVSPLRY